MQEKIDETCEDEKLSDELNERYVVYDIFCELKSKIIQLDEKKPQSVQSKTTTFAPHVHCNGR